MSTEAIPIRKFLIEGLDRLGKSTLISNILNKYGYYDVIHYEKPKLLTSYKLEAEKQQNADNLPLKLYQIDSFCNMFRLCASDANIIFDRAHLGEMVYAALYRNYPGDYVFTLERAFGMGNRKDTRLILLISSNFNFLIDDGLSFNTANREKEQQLFIDAFEKSQIKDKIIIDVHDGHGGFRSPEQILEEAIR